MFRQVQPLQLFATPLWAQEVAPAERPAFDAELLAGVRALPPGTSPADLHRAPPFARFVAAALQMGESVLERLQTAQRGLEIVRLEALVEAPGTASPARVQPNAYLAGLYLVAGSGQWAASDPRPQAHLLTAPLAEPSPATAESLSLPLAAGRLLLFPAFLRHQTLPNPGPGPRALLAFALSFRDFVDRLSPPRWERKP